jgi:hypothetical protein
MVLALVITLLFIGRRRAEFQPTDVGPQADGSVVVPPISSSGRQDFRSNFTAVQ